MAQKIRIKSKSVAASEKKLNAILHELRFLRNDIFMLLPQESLKAYAHPKKIRRAYLRAMKQHPPVV